MAGTPANGPTSPVAKTATDFLAGGSVGLEANSTMAIAVAGTSVSAGNASTVWFSVLGNEAAWTALIHGRHVGDAEAMASAAAVDEVFART